MHSEKMYQAKLGILVTLSSNERHHFRTLGFGENVCHSLLYVDPSLYTRSQRAMAELKGVVYELLCQSDTGLSNAEIGRRLGIYGGHVGHEGHISRTILGLLEKEEVIVQDKKTKVWTIRKLGSENQESAE
jgi:hypothetical protein